MVEMTVRKLAQGFNPYPDLLVNPQVFVDIFMFSQPEQFKTDLLPGELALLSEENVRFCTNYSQCFIDTFKEQIYKTGDLIVCFENDLKLEFLLNGMLAILIKYISPFTENTDQKAFIIDYFSKIIKITFPQHLE